MERSSDGFVRADQIDLKSLDEQLERHLLRVRTMEKNKIQNNNNNHEDISNIATVSPSPFYPVAVPRRQRHEWEIDPSKLIIKSVIARGTFGTVHRGIYDGQDVAGLLTMASDRQKCGATTRPNFVGKKKRACFWGFCSECKYSYTNLI